MFIVNIIASVVILFVVIVIVRSVISGKHPDVPNYEESQDAINNGVKKTSINEEVKELKEIIELKNDIIKKLNNRVKQLEGENARREWNEEGNIDRLIDRIEKVTRSKNPPKQH